MSPTPRRLHGPAFALVAALSFALFVSGPAAASAAEPGTPAPAPGHAPKLDTADAVARAILVRNPALSTIEQQIDALRHEVPRAGVWMDPMAGVEYSNMPITAPWPGNHPMSGIQLKVQQTIPGPGKTGARTDVARAKLATAKQDLAEKQNELVGLARDLYDQLALVRQLEAITKEHIALVDQFIDVVRASYEVGKAHQHDLLRLEVLRDKLEDDLADLDDKVHRLEAVLVAALHLPAGTPVTTPADTPAPGPTETLAALVDRAKKERPMLAKLVDAARTQALAARRAEVEERPDVTVWLGYRIRVPAGTDPGTDFVTAGASIPLPWFWNDRRWGELAQVHRAKGRALGDARRAAIDDIRGKLDADLSRWKRSADKAKRYHDKLVPEARHTLDATFAAYQVGRADFASVYQAELELLNFERTIRIAETDAARASVQVNVLVGAYAPKER